MSKKNKEKIVELQYSIEALEDEVSYLVEQLAQEHSKLWEVIQENDRLTITYEPYRPPGDEYEGLGFYELIEENDSLTKKLLDKIKVIEELDEINRNLYDKKNLLTSDLIDLRTEVSRMKNTMKPKRQWSKKYPKAGCVTIDFWPPRDWFRLSYHPWKPGMAAQLCIGPIRIDFFQS